VPNSLKSALVRISPTSPSVLAGGAEMLMGCSTIIRGARQRAYPLMIERFMALAFAPGPSATNTLSAAAVCRLTRPAAMLLLPVFWALKLDRPVLALCPGARVRRKAKRLPAEQLMQGR